MSALASAILLVLTSPAWAGAVEAELGGNLKLFHTSTYPFDNDLFAPQVQDGSAFLRTDYPLEEDTIRAQAGSSGLLTGRLAGTLYAGDFTFGIEGVAQVIVDGKRQVALARTKVRDPHRLVQLQR